MASQIEGRFALLKIKEALVMKAMASRLYQPLRSFFRGMELVWGEAETAHASLKNGCPVITLGVQFFNEKVQDEGEAAEVVMHEIMHHLFRHLDQTDWSEKGYSDSVQNLAMDAVINAYLNSVGCAGFMARFYQDEGEYAFLRPGSEEFSRKGFLGKKETIQKWGNDHMFCYHAWNKKAMEFLMFYKDLYKLQVSLEQSLEFFRNHFEKPDNKLPMLGSHTSGQPKKGKGANKPQPASSKPGPGAGKNGESADSQPRGPEQDPNGTQSASGIFPAKEAQAILESLGLKPAIPKAKRTFSQVIQKITASVSRPGVMRAQATYSRRVPAKIGRRDMIGIERGREIFTRPDYRTREVILMFDVSGSMTVYRQFVIDLAKSLVRTGVKVRPIVWAVGIQEVPYAQFIAGEFPDVGGGTQGEIVAQFINAEHIAQTVLVTDNCAGTIVSKVQAKVHLCLVEGSSQTGSFADKTAVPHCETYWLE